MGPQFDNFLENFRAKLLIHTNNFELYMLYGVTRYHDLASLFKRIEGFIGVPSLDVKDFVLPTMFTSTMQFLHILGAYSREALIRSITVLSSSTFLMSSALVLHRLVFLI